MRKPSSKKDVFCHFSSVAAKKLDQMFLPRRRTRPVLLPLRQREFGRSLALEGKTCFPFFSQQNRSMLISNINIHFSLCRWSYRDDFAFLASMSDSQLDQWALSVKKTVDDFGAHGNLLLPLFVTPCLFKICQLNETLTHLPYNVHGICRYRH